jgi:hypothetical protein
MISRRKSLVLLSAAGAALLARKAVALVPAKEWREVWPEVQQGDFGTAAERLLMHVTERPLDHEARVCLATMQFADGQFDAAARSLEPEVRLRRSYARTEPTGTDFDAVECWHYLAMLRAGQDVEIPAAQYQPSLLSLLGGNITLDEFLEQGVAALEVAYEQAEQAMKVIAQAMEQSTDERVAKVAPLFSFQKPDRQSIMKSLTCPARFMLGEQALGQKDMSAARTHLASSMATSAVSLVEYHIAKAELARLG